MRLNQDLCMCFCKLIIWFEKKTEHFDDVLITLNLLFLNSIELNLMCVVSRLIPLCWQMWIQGSFNCHKSSLVIKGLMCVYRSFAVTKPKAYWHKLSEINHGHWKLSMMVHEIYVEDDSNERRFSHLKSIRS